MLAKQDRTKVLFLLLSLVSIVGYSQAELPSNLRVEIERRIENGINNGLAIATIDSTGNVDYYNFGLEHDGGTIIKESSTFEIASISKTFTSTLIRYLEETTQLSIEEEIRGFVPDSLPEHIKKITFDQLINHTSGLPRLPFDYWTSNWNNPYSDYNRQEFLSDLMVVQLDPLRNWNYSNTGYALLGVIIDGLTEGKGLENIISSIGLSKTSSALDSKTSTTPHNFGRTVEGWDFPSFNRYMGGIKSSSADMAQYLLYQVKNNAAFYNPYSEAVIPINEKDALFCKDGWLVFYRNKEEIIWHNGISGGYNSFIGYNIQKKSGIIVLANSQSSITDIGLHYLSSSFPLNEPKTSLAIKIEEHINSQQLDAIRMAWNTPDSEKFDKNPMDLYWLQCHYISKGKLEIALLLNDLLWNDYKDDWEVVFYRAKIYEMLQAYNNARDCYEKANELFPENKFILPLIKVLPEN
jgi:CubicO group peptidase (beta-lactamase class C family)